MAYSLPKDAVWLITGCSSGIGAALATRLATTTSSRVVATARNVSALAYLKDDNNVLKVALNVTSPESIDEAFRQAVEKFGRVDVVVNNAGYTIFGDEEAMTLEEGKALFETNFWGTVNVTNHALPVLRDQNPKTGQKGGLILYVSSVGGFVTSPGNAFYHASKHAMEGFADALQKELDPNWGIRSVIFQPGGTATEYAGTSMKVPAMGRHPAYDRPELPTSTMMAMFGNAKAMAAGFSTADDIAKGICETVGAPVEGVRAEKEMELPLRVPLGVWAWGAVAATMEARRDELLGLEKFSTRFGGDLGAVAEGMLKEVM
ncbi:retinol dehydrogenase 8 [Xylariaceae sp. FL0255]|nr:retinol dehydrogenase 8 [Xylariaceae sp. FL0255]